MEAGETVRCRGHPLVRGAHRTTFEVTKDESMTRAGDCIIAVSADKGAADLSPEFRRVLSHDSSMLTTRLVSGGISVEIHSRGSAGFTLDHPTDLVWRRSGYVCGRTIGIHSDHTAATLPRELIDRLGEGGELIVEMYASRPR